MEEIIFDQTENEHETGTKSDAIPHQSRVGLILSVEGSIRNINDNRELRTLVLKLDRRSLQHIKVSHFSHVRITNCLHPNGLGSKEMTVHIRRQILRGL